MRPMVFVGLASLLAVPAVFAQSFTTAPCSNSDGRVASLVGLLAGTSVREPQARHCRLPAASCTWSARTAASSWSVKTATMSRWRRRWSRRPHRTRRRSGWCSDVRVETDGTIHAEGPKTGNWSVNYKLRVPRHLAAELHTENGGISVANVDGTVHAETTNGGISLSDLSGDVHATTTNGGLHISLTGDSWHGAGLVAKSTNGGVHVTMPANYSAHLIAGTVNGGTDVRLPMTTNVISSRRHIDGQIGHGGATVQVETVNGGVSID